MRAGDAGRAVDSTLQRARNDGSAAEQHPQVGRDRLRFVLQLTPGDARRRASPRRAGSGRVRDPPRMRRSVPCTARPSSSTINRWPCHRQSTSKKRPRSARSALRRGRGQAVVVERGRRSASSKSLRVIPPGAFAFKSARRFAVPRCPGCRSSKLRQGDAVEKLPHIRLVQRPFERLPRAPPRGRTVFGRGSAGMPSPYAISSAARSDSCAAMPGRRMRRPPERVISIGPEPGDPRPQSSGRPMTENSAWPAGEHRGHPASLAVESPTADRVDTAVDDVEAPSLDCPSTALFRISSNCRRATTPCWRSARFRQSPGPGSSRRLTSRGTTQLTARPASPARSGDPCSALGGAPRVTLASWHKPNEAPARRYRLWL